MFITTDILNKIKTNAGYKESTLKTLDNDIKRLYKLSGLDSFNTELLNDYKKVIDTLELNKTDKTIKIIPQSARSRLLTWIIKVYEAIPEHNKKTLEAYKKKLGEYMASNKQSEVLKEAPENREDKKVTKAMLEDLLLRWVDIVAKNPSPTNLSKYFLVAVYYYLPAVRGQDLYSLAWKDRKEDASNYIDLEAGTINISDWKTKKENDKNRVIKMPPELLNIAETLHDALDSDWVLPNLKDLDNHRTSSAHTKFMLSIFDGVSTQILRQSFVAELYDRRATPQEKRDAAEIMAHSVPVQATVYQQYSQATKKEKEPINSNMTKEEIIKTIQEKMAEITKLLELLK